MRDISDNMLLKWTFDLSTVDSGLCLNFECRQHFAFHLSCLYYSAIDLYSTLHLCNILLADMSYSQLPTPPKPPSPLATYIIYALSPHVPISPLAPSINYASSPHVTLSPLAQPILHLVPPQKPFTSSETGVGGVSLHPGRDLVYLQCFFCWQKFD